MRVIIDPGHGGDAPNGRSSPYGARGPGGTLERDVVLQLSQLVASELGGAAQLTRYGNSENPSLSARAEMARNAGASVFVSLHANYGGADARGTETWIHDRADRRSEALAAHVQRALIGAGCADGGIGRGALGVLAPERHFGGTAACLVEVDYLSDPYAERRLGDPRELGAYARAIAQGISAYGRYGDGFDLVACTLGIPARGMASVLQVPPTDTAPSAAEQQLIDTAFQQSRQTLRTARSALQQLRTGIATTGRPRNDFEERVMISVGRWLHAPTSPLQADRQELVRVLDLALRLFDLNLGVAVGAGFFRRRMGATFHAESFIGRRDLGLAVGDPFVTTDGPKCRRDVITHELFHMVGVHHGDGIGNLNIARAAVTTSAGALDSADHLAQLISEIMDGTTDSC